MRVLEGRAAAARVRTIAGRSSQPAGVEAVVQTIVEDVRRSGDRALRKYARRWDGLGVRDSLRVDAEEIRAAWKSAPAELRRALQQAAANIRQFCEWQKPAEWKRTQGGVTLGQLVRPLQSVGCYVPGGRYPLVSTLLMTVIPAQVAGVKNIRVVSPQPRAELLAAAGMLGVEEFYRVGGAQAIAALAYGTESIARVDKIVGPGNSFVTAAKKVVSFDCAIDFLAGPTEVLIVSGRGKAGFIAADLVAQAEHDPQALPLFITTSRRLAKEVLSQVEIAARENSLAQQSLAASGAILLAASRRQAMGWANQIAPEHITLEREDLPHVQNAGSVFLGDYSPQAAGDYASGPNHVLPTAGVARFRGGLSVLDFVKLITVQELSQRGLRRIAPTIEHLAGAEGLRAHAKSIRVRSAHA
jgi:histidinol dehydrogenase